MGKPSCIICGKSLNSGIIINGRALCTCCEKKIIECSMETDFYNFYKDCIKRRLTSKLTNKGVELPCGEYHF